MTVQRVVPHVETGDFEAARDFYVNLFGFKTEMERRSLVTLVSPVDPGARIMLQGSVAPDLTIEVEDVDAAFAEAERLGHQIVHPLTDEEWGARRFFVKAPDGHVVSVQQLRKSTS